jgi:hypothetical protein
MSTEYDTDDGHDKHDHGEGNHHDDDRDRGYHEHTECEDCDPDLIDDLKCQAEGIAAQAAYNAATQPELLKASEDYATARGAYRTARAAATPQVQELRHQAKQLVERIRCQINQDQVVDCLDRAYRHICHRLEKCGDGGGCCSADDCAFDKTCPDSYDELVRQIAEYQARVDREKACFATLIGEPAALTVRVAAVKAEIDAINADLAGDQATVDLKKLYVAALVAQRHLDMVWNGFSHTRDYVDCLCRALTCWTKASDAVSVLTGCKAVKDCQKAARQKCCDDLATKTVEEILLEYERLCGSERCEDEDTPAPSDDDDEDHEEDDPPCHCDHGHEHRRSHHRHKHRHDS